MNKVTKNILQTGRDIYLEHRDKEYCADTEQLNKGTFYRQGEADSQLEKFLPGLVERVDAVCETLR